MNEWLLSDEEIDAFNYYGGSVVSEDNWNLRGMLQAQLRKVIEAVERRESESMNDIEHPFSANYTLISLKAWQELKKEAGLDH